MSRLHALTVLALAVALGSCGQGIDAPPAPDLQPVLQAYATPTAVVDGAIMSEFAQEIEDAAREIEDSEIFEEILDVIIEVQQELKKATAGTCSGGDDDGSTCDVGDDTACPNGTCVATGLVFGATCSGGDNDGGACDVNDDTACPNGECGGGVTIPSPTGAIRVNYICPGLDPRQFDDGYEADPDPANGSIDLFMTLDSAGIGRVVWGTAAKCLYLVPIDGDNCEASGCVESSYDGGVALDLGDTVPPDEDITQLLVTFVLEGTIGLDDINFPINQSFRVKLADTTELVILVDIGDPALTETFNYIFQGDAQLIRDKNGVFGCSLERSECFDDSGILFSW
ncbi:MAG: hypothetical protein WBB42_15495 [Polyangiales bacterium]